MVWLECCALIRFSFDVLFGGAWGCFLRDSVVGAEILLFFGAKLACLRGL